MAEFPQNAQITTLHDLANRPLLEVESELATYSKRRVMSLLVSASSSSVERASLAELPRALRQATYLSEVIVGLEAADPSQFRHALDYLRPLSQRHRIICNASPRLAEIDKQLTAAGLAPPTGSRERVAWYSLGYVLAASQAEAIAMHRIDGSSCQRALLSKLFYPVAKPALSFEFCKAYRSDTSPDGLAGRTERLLLAPLIQAFATVFGPNEYLSYLDGFHSPLASDLAFRRSLILDLRLPDKGALQLGLLSEVQRQLATNRICQMDVSCGQPRTGNKPQNGHASRIIELLFHYSMRQGLVVDAPSVQTIKMTYQKLALDFLKAYHNDSLANGLAFDAHSTEKLIERFADDVCRAGKALPAETGVYSPSWKRAISAVPNILSQLLDAIELDHHEFASPAVFISCARPPQGPLSASA